MYNVHVLILIFFMIESCLLKKMGEREKTTTYYDNQEVHSAITVVCLVIVNLTAKFILSDMVEPTRSTICPINGFELHVTAGCLGC